MLRLALPVIATYLGIMLMGLVDILFVGRLNAESIGAVGVGTSFFTWVMIFGIGLLAGLDYLVSFAQGAGRPEDGYRALVQSLISTSALSLPMTLVLLALSRHLDLFGIDATVIPLARTYLGILAVSLWPVFVFNACRQYLTALGVAMPGLIALIGGNVVNALANWLLIFGHWGMPQLGVDGSAWATVSARYLMMLGMVAYLLYWDRKHDGFFARVPFRIEWDRMKRFLSLGLPSALQMLLEVGVFALSTLLAARLTAQALAAHMIVLNIASFTFMVPLGLSSATAVLVGQALGRGDPREARRMGWRGLGSGAAFMTCSGIALFLGHGWLLPFFTMEAAVHEIAAQIILVAALFQLSDGVQVVGTGALRGLGDTRSPLAANLAGHWLVGLPSGLLLCFTLAWGLQGLWVGLSLGLTAVAASLLIVWSIRSREKARGAGAATAPSTS
jgi:MATE family multidrug resistance protein